MSKSAVKTADGSPVSKQVAVRIVDADVHPGAPIYESARPYLPPSWRPEDSRLTPSAGAASMGGQLTARPSASGSGKDHASFERRVGANLRV
jgi:hypothetical protein